jgi:hypothetical protein
MDLYYFYNGMNNILNLSMNHKDYLLNSKKIHSDPLILLDLDHSFNLKGGSGAAGAAGAGGAGAGAGAAAKMAPAKGRTDKPKDDDGEDGAEGGDEMKQVGNMLNRSLVIFANKQATDRKEEKKQEKKQELRAQKKKAKTEAEQKEVEATEIALKEAAQEEEEAAQEQIDEEIKEMEEAQAARNQKESLTDRGTEALKLLIKLVVFLAFVTLLPIAPFIAISYYSFKKLKDYYDNQIVTL